MEWDDDTWQTVIGVIGVIGVILGLVFKVKGKISKWMRTQILNKSKKAYQSFEKGKKSSVEPKPTANIEIKRPNWDTDKSLSSAQINLMSQRAENAFENFNSPKKYSLPPTHIDKRKKNPTTDSKPDDPLLENHQAFHLSDGFKYASTCKVTDLKAGTISASTLEASNEIIKWTETNYRNSIGFSIAYLTGRVSIGKSTLITTVCEKLNYKIASARKKRTPTREAVLPIYLNFNTIVKTYHLREDKTNFPSQSVFPTLAAETILEQNMLEITKDNEVRDAVECLESYYGRLLIFIDSLDQFYYQAVMDELLEEGEEETTGTISINKYENYIKGVVELIQHTFNSKGNYSSIDLVLAMRNETLDRIRPSSNASSDTQLLNSINGQVRWDLDLDLDKQKAENRERDIILGRLKLLREYPKLNAKKESLKLNAKIEDRVLQIENQIKTNLSYFEHFNLDLSVGLGLNGQRDLLHKIRCISWTVFDERLERIFNNRNLSLIHYMLNENLRYTQSDTHLLNLFLIWNKSKRNNPDIGNGILIPKKLRAFHLPTYWLKYIVLKLISVEDNSGVITKGELENILAKKGVKSYEKHLVQLVLFSLQETTHGRFIKKAIETETGKFAGLELTVRGKEFIKDEISFDMNYLALISEDKNLATPLCFDYNDWFSKGRYENKGNYKNFLYASNDEKFNDGYRKYIEISIGKTICFLYLLEKAMKWETKAFKNAYKEIENKFPRPFDSGRIFPNLDEIEIKIIRTTKEKYLKLGGTQKEFTMALKYARRMILENGDSLEQWYEKMYGKLFLLTNIKFNSAIDLMETEEFVDPVNQII